MERSRSNPIYRSRIMRFLVGIVVILLTLADTAEACTITIVGLRKAYRASSQIFVGEFLSFGDSATDALPSKLAGNRKMLDKARFRIQRSWKGPASGEVELYLSPVCDCPMREISPDRGDRFLILADKDGVVDACNMYIIEMTDNRRQEDLKRIVDRLDSFWFRTWAGIYPF